MEKVNINNNRFCRVCGAMLLVVSIFVTAISVPQKVEAADWNKLTTELVALEKVLRDYSNSLTGKVLGARVISVQNDKELLDAIMTASGGETIALSPGNYGRIFIVGKLYFQSHVGSNKVSGAPTFTQPIKITSADLNNRAVIREIELRHFGNIHFENLSIRPAAKRPAVSLNGANNSFVRNDITYGIADNWTAQQWKDTVGKVTALTISGDNTVAAYNYLKNVGHGIMVGKNSHVHHNYIEDFSADGMRGNSDNAIIEHNYIIGPIKVDTNHDDGFQSFSRGADGKVGTGVVKNVVLRRNSFILFHDGHPLRANTMQGIGMFDGYFEDWIIENNLVLTDTWHGISVYGGINTVIRNNLALDVTQARPGPLWVKFFNHKNGTPSVGGVVEGNITNRPTPLEGNTAVSWSQYGNYFVDHLNGDFRLKPGAVPFSVGAEVDFNKLAPNPLTLTAGQAPTVPEPSPVTEPVPVDNSVTNEQETTETEENIAAKLPAAQFNVSDLRPTVGQTITFDGTQSLRADRWVWDDAAGALGQWPLGEGRVINFTFQKPGIKKVRLMVSNNYGEDTLIIPIEVKSAVETILEKEPVTDSSPNDVIISDETTPSEAVETVTPPLSNTRVVTTDNLNVRHSPDGELVALILLGSEGTLSSQPAINAAGYNWVYVAFDNGVRGYVADTFLSTLTPGVDSPNHQNLTPSDAISIQRQITELLQILVRLQAQLNLLLQNQ